MLQIIKNRGYFYTVSIILFVVSVLLWIMWGLKTGIDFTGGSLMEVEYSGVRPSVADIREALDPLHLEGVNIQTAGETGYLMRFKEVNEEAHQKILQSLTELSEKSVAVEAQGQGTAVATASSVTEKRFTTIGPAIGAELRTKSVYATFLVCVGIVLYIAWSFRKVSYPISSWKYGVAAIAALLHDVVVTIGIFVILGRYLGIEVNTPFIAALLTILGYSVNDTIVVFDRIRENLHRYEGDFDEIVNKSVNETLRRSVATSMTVLLVLLATFFFGGATIRDFTIALICGVVFGAYSSIFIASALLVDWHRIASRVKGE